MNKIASGKYRLVKGKAIFFLIVPSVILLGFLFFGSLVSIGVLSFNTYQPGRVYPKGFNFTCENYIEFVGSIPYLRYLLITLRIAFFASLGAVIPGYFFAYYIVRTTPRRRKLLIVFFVGMLFVSTLARIYAIAVLFSGVGIMNQVLGLLGVPEVRFMNTEFLVILGLIHWLLPIAVLSMMGPVKNISPKLEQAANTLGADWLKAKMHVTLPLSVPALGTGFLLSFPLGVSAFVIPSILGGGRVLMIANIIYSRTGTLNFPAAAALSLILLAVALFSIFAINWGLNLITERRV